MSGKGVDTLLIFGATGDPGDATSAIKGVMARASTIGLCSRILQLDSSRSSERRGFRD